MLFHSIEFFIFFPVAVLGYFVIPKRLKNIWLLGASYYFYMSWNVLHTLLIAFSTIVTYTGGLLMGSCRGSGKEQLIKRGTAAVCFFINLGILGVFKYSDFAWYNLNIILTKMGFEAAENTFHLLLPAGISFYTFQALGYTVDVYRGEIEPEKNIINYALFVSFFPQLVAGPIERSKNLLNQISGIREMSLKKLFDLDRIAGGLTLMLWGYFQKLVIADRIAVFADHVYGSWYLYGAVEIFAATAAFSIQIYCDFAGYSLIAAGAAKVLGFQLMENFNTPYFSRSIRDYWRRWHISLSTWFRDYLYIPLGGSRCGRLRRHINLILTFLVSGLWHGAGWHYAAWGVMQGVYQVIGTETEGIRNRIRTRTGARTDTFGYKFGQTAVTYFLILFSLVFFRAGSMGQAFDCIRRMIAKLNPWVITDGSLYSLGLDQAQVFVLFLSLGILFCVSIVRYRKNQTLEVFLSGQCIWFRWLVLVVLAAFLFLFGVYGPEYDESQFIYFQF